jgi:hypothetical protein
LAGCLHMEWDGMRMCIYVEQRFQAAKATTCQTAAHSQCSVSYMFIIITWDEVGGRVCISRGSKAPYFTRHFDGLPALIPWFSTGSMVSMIPSFITYRIIASFSPLTSGGHTIYIITEVDIGLISWYKFLWVAVQGIYHWHFQCQRGFVF